MPQTKRDPRAFLQRQQQTKRDPAAFLQRQQEVAPPRAQQPQAQQPEGILSSFQTGVAGPLLRNVVETAADFYNAPGETLERVGRGALEFASAFDPAGKAYEPTVQGQAARVAELNRRADERLPEPIQSMKRGLAIEEARPRSTAASVAKGAGSLAGEVAFPTAPESVAANIVTIPFGAAAVRSAGQAVRAVPPILRRIRGGRNVPVGEALPPVPVVETPLPARTFPVSRPPGSIPSPAGPAVPGRPAAPPTLPGPGPAIRQRPGALPSPLGPRPTVETLPSLSAEGPIPQVSTPLQTAYGKLGTEAVEDIGAMIESANRRFKKSASEAQRKQSIEDFNRLNQLTPDEERALGQVLPARTVSPVRGQFKGEGPYSRDISDIPNTEPNPQLDANLRELEAFFSSMGKVETPIPAVRPPIAGALTRLARNPDAPVSMTQLRREFPSLNKQQFDDEMIRLNDEGQVALHRHDHPASLSQAQRENMVRSGADYFTAVTTRGPRVGETAALTVKAAKAAADPSLVKPQERTKVLETISALRKAGLLTGLKTHIRNVAGTGAFQISEELARVPASMIDLALSTVTKRRTITGPNIGAVARSGYEAATKGASEAWEIIRKGATAEDLARNELKQINSGSKVLDGYINGVFRTLNAEDRLFRTYALRRSLEDRARSATLTEIRQGVIPRGDYGRRVKELLSKPPQDMVDAAITDAEVAVFTNQNVVSRFMEAGKGAVESRPGGRAATFAGDLVFPFVKTPTNIIARMLEYSPAGFGKNAVQVARGIVKKSFTDAEQRAFAQTFGRASIGSGIIALGWKLYNDGLLTGLIEDDPTRRSRDLAAGRTPGSIKVGNKWLQLTSFAPLGSLLVIGATLARETEQEEGGLLSALPETAGRAVLEQPLLIGTEQILKAAREPGTVGARAIGGLAGSFVPTAVSDLAEAIDPTQRQATDLTGRLLQRVPGARATLPPAEDVLGLPKQDFGPAQAFLDPTRATTDVAQTNPVFRELVRLDAGLSGFRKGKNETDDAFRAKVQQFGRLYTQYAAQLINSPQYAAADDATKRLMLDTLNSRAKSLVTRGEERDARFDLSPRDLLDAAQEQAENAADKNKK